MTKKTQQAVEWALSETYPDPFIDGVEYPITKNTPVELVSKVREYFNDHNIEYSTFDYNDLKPFLN